MGRKWANIVAKKTAKDGANSKVYAKFGVEIYVAAKKGEPLHWTQNRLTCYSALPVMPDRC